MYIIISETFVFKCITPGPPDARCCACVNHKWPLQRGRGLDLTAPPPACTFLPTPRVLKTRRGGQELCVWEQITRSGGVVQRDWSAMPLTLFNIVCMLECWTRPHHIVLNNNIEIRENANADSLKRLKYRLNKMVIAGL